MPKLIYDEFSDLPISRQLRYQRRRMAVGRCKLCGAQAIHKSPYCEQHRQMAAASKAGRMPFTPRSAATELPIQTPQATIAPSTPTLEEII